MFTVTIETHTNYFHIKNSILDDIAEVLDYSHAVRIALNLVKIYLDKHEGQDVQIIHKIVS